MYFYGQGSPFQAADQLKSDRVGEQKTSRVGQADPFRKLRWLWPIQCCALQNVERRAHLCLDQRLFSAMV